MIDIIIVNFNAGQHLTSCVLSALQSSLPIKIFISDNGSTDNSLELLKEKIGDHPLITIQENRKNLGFSKANNAVFQKTTANYVLFLNPDCIIQPDTLERLMIEFNKRIDVGMVGCLIRNEDGTEQIGCRRKIPTPWSALTHSLRLHKVFPKHPWFSNFVLTDEPIPDQPVSVESISGAFMLVKRTAIEEVGLLDEEYFLHCEDLDWCMRFWKSNWQILLVPGVEIIHAKGACSQKTPIKVIWHKHKGMIRFYHKFFRKRCSRILLWGIALLVWLRFSLMMTKTLLLKPR